MSVSGSTFSPLTCSGAIQPVVPTTRPVRVSEAPSAAEAMPKSMTFKPALGAQHVGRLQVAVHEAHRVDRQQRLGEPGGEGVLAPAVERPVLRDEAGEVRARGRIR